MQFLNKVDFIIIFFAIFVPILFSIIFIFKYTRVTFLKYVFSTLFILAICIALYIIYCHINPKKLTHYCIDRECISIVIRYGDSGINSPIYLRIYDKKIFARLQLEINDYIEFIFEGNVFISNILFDNKINILSSNLVEWTNSVADNVYFSDKILAIDSFPDGYIEISDLWRDYGSKLMY